MAGDADSSADQLKKLIALYLAALMVYGREFAQGRISPQTFPGLLLPVVAEYHSRAGILGRTAAGIDGPHDEADAAFGQMQADRDGPYLQNFAGQLADGWGIPAEDDSDGSDADEDEQPDDNVDDEADPGAVSLPAMQNRLDLYAQRLHASAHEAFVMAMPAGTLYHWRLDSADPCQDCPVIASGGPYDEDTLPSFPGDGSTQCMTRCKCWLETEAGHAPFAS